MRKLMAKENFNYAEFTDRNWAFINKDLQERIK